MVNTVMVNSVEAAGWAIPLVGITAEPFRHRRSGQGGDGQGYALKTFHVNIQKLSQRQVKSWNEKTAYSLEKTTISFWTTKFPPQGKLSWQMETRLFHTKDSICHLFTDLFSTATGFVLAIRWKRESGSARDLIHLGIRNFVNSFIFQITESIWLCITFRWSHDLVSGTFTVVPWLPRW